MTKNERLNQISTEAFEELCEIADRHRGKRSKWGEAANEKWWITLYPAVHIPLGKEWYIGTCYGLTFPSCDISQLPINLGSRFTFSTRESAQAFGDESKELWLPFLFPELTIMTRTR